MLKKLATIVAFVSLSISGLVSLTSPASAVTAATDATLKTLEVHAGTNINSNAFTGAVAWRGLQTDSDYYDVYSTWTTLGVYVEPTDPDATVKVTGGGNTNATPSLTNAPYSSTLKYINVNLNSAVEQIVSVVVTAGDGTTTKTYTLKINANAIPQPQIISNSLSNISTAGGELGIMYAKNFTSCAKISFAFKYTDENGDLQQVEEPGDWSIISTDSSGVSKVGVYNSGIRKSSLFRDAAGHKADLIVSNDANSSYNNGGCVDYTQTNDQYADVVIPNAVTYYNPSVVSTTMPDTISQNTTFLISGPGMNSDAALSIYFTNPATGNSMWSRTYRINNDSMMVTVDPYATGEEWRSKLDLVLHIEQYDNRWNEEDTYSDSVTLLTKNVKFTPDMASQVSVSPAKGPISGGNKVTITGHGICNPWNERWADITIGGNPVTDMRVPTCEFYTSSDNKKWDGISKATFIVPAGVAGPADITVDSGYGPTTLSQKYIYGDKPKVSSIAPSSVAVTGGSIITLTGTNFGVSGTPIVIIDGVKSSYVVRVSSTKVLAMVPAHTGTGDVSVDLISSSGGGALDTLAKLTYVARGTNPTVTKITPNTDGVSGGSEVVITGTGFNATATGVTIGGVAAKITAATTTSLTVESPSADAVGNADVVVATPTGLVTKVGAFTYSYDPGITTISPNTIASYATAAEAKVTISGHAFGTSGKITIGSGAAVNYTATANGTTISNVEIPTNVAGSVKISILPTGEKKAFTSTVTVTAPQILSITPKNVDPNGFFFGDANPWTFTGVGLYAAPANNGGDVIVVYGKGFGSAGTLKIGSTTVPTTTYTDTEIVFVSPSNIPAGQYDLEVIPSLGTLTAVAARSLQIGAQLPNPQITSVAANAPTHSGETYDFWPNTTDSDLYTITGSGFLGSDAGATTKVKMESFSDYYYNRADNWVTVSIVSKTDTQIVFHADRSLSTFDSKAVQVVTNLSNVVLGQGIYYDDIQTSYGSGASLDNWSGLCNKDAIGTYTPGIFHVTDQNNSLFTSGIVKLNGVRVLGGVTWSAGAVTINLDNSTNISNVWGSKVLSIQPGDSSEPTEFTINCGVRTTLTTKLNGSTADLTVAAGTSYTPSVVLNNPLPATTFDEPSDNYEYQTKAMRSAGSSGWIKGLPFAAGEYYVRARIAGATYDATKYIEFTSDSDVHLTLTGTAITLTPKLNAGGATLVYKGQLGDGTNGSSSDIGFTVSPTPADAVTAVTYQYRNHACTDKGWLKGLPKNVAVIPQNCGGNGTDVGTWDIRVASYEMLNGGVDKTYLYIPTFGVFNLSITKKDVTLSTVKAEKVYDGTTSVTLNDIKVTGAVNDETPSLDPTFARGATFADATAGANKPVTLGGAFKLYGIYDTNYQITNPNMVVTGTIKKADTEVKITSPVTSVVLGKTPTVELTLTNLDTKTHRDPIVEANAIAPIIVDKTTSVCSINGTTVTPIAAGDCVIQVTVPSSTNYNAGVSYHNSPETVETVTIKVYGAPKDIAVVADDLKIAVGDALNPSATITGLLDGDSFDNVSFDYYSGSTKLNSAPTAVGTYKIVASAGSLTAANSDAYNPTVKYIAAKLVITPAPPVITSVSPSHGPEAGGNVVVIKGTGLAAVTSITLGTKTIRKPTFTVDAAGTQISFVVPAGIGGMDIALNAGSAEADTAYTYDAPFRAVVVPTPANPDGNPAALSLKLTLKLAVGSKLSGQKVQIAGGGLKANSTYVLEMHSDPIQIWTGTTDANGNFDEQITLPAKVCLSPGKHSLKLSGITPAGAETSDTAFFSLVDACIVGATVKKVGDKSWTLDGFLFAYCSPDLSAGGKQSLDALIEFIDGAKKVTILGYTETDTKSAVIKKLNLKLAKDRTITVMKYLKSKGIKATYVTIGKGGVDPVSTTNQAKNRRVVIQAKY